MSIFRYLFDHDWFQRADIDRLEAETSRLHADLWSRQHENRDIAEENEALRREVSRLVLVVEAMNRLGIERNLWTADDMTRTLERVDLEDGVADGKRTKAAPVGPSICVTCGKPIPRHVAKCLHCNTPRAQS